MTGHPTGPDLSGNAEKAARFAASQARINEQLRDAWQQGYEVGRRPVPPGPPNPPTNPYSPKGVA